MTSFVFANNVNTQLAAAISSSATTITLASSANLPSSIPASTYFAITLNDQATRQVYEIMYATAVSGSNLTVIRAQEGTTAVAWGVGDFAFSDVTAGELRSLVPSAGGVTSFNTRTGVVTLTASDVNTALTYTAANDANVVHKSGNETVAGIKTFTSTLNASALTTSSGDVTSAGQVTATLAVNSGSNFTSSSAAVSLNTTGAGTVTLRPNGQGVTTGQTTLSSAGNLVAAGTITPGSDERIKTNVRPIKDALNTVRVAMVGVEYDRLDQDGAPDAGFIAQRVKKYLPHLVPVTETHGFDDFHSMNYNGATAYLAAAVTELHDIVLKQQARIDALERAN